MENALVPVRPPLPPGLQPPAGPGAAGRAAFLRPRRLRAWLRLLWLRRGRRFEH